MTNNTKNKKMSKKASVESIFIPDNSHIRVEQKLYEIREREEEERMKKRNALKEEKSCKSLTSHNETDDENGDSSSPTVSAKKNRKEIP